MKLEAPIACLGLQFEYPVRAAVLVRVIDQDALDGHAPGVQLVGIAQKAS